MQELHPDASVLHGVHDFKAHLDTLSLGRDVLPQEGFFEQREICRLSKDYAIHLGHAGKKCPKPLGNPWGFTITDENGVHGTRVQYCGCPVVGKDGKAGEPKEKWRQLFDARIFPGTFAKTRTAYTFGVLRAFEIHSAASKKNAKDFVKALNQMSNRAYPEDNPVSYSVVRARDALLRWFDSTSTPISKWQQGYGR